MPAVKDYLSTPSMPTLSFVRHVMSNRKNGQPLWWVRPIIEGYVDDSAGHAFAGTETEMVEHIGKLHRETGVQHAAVCPKQ